jgi:hypothetical protein
MPDAQAACYEKPGMGFPKAIVDRKTMPVTHPTSPHLKLYTERSPKVVRPPIEAIGSLPGVLRAFQA